MESSRTFALHAFCTWLYSTRKNNFVAKKNCSRPVRFCWPCAAGPTHPPPSIVDIASGHVGGRPAATMLQAGASMHQVKMSACLWVIWVIWVIVFYCKLAPVAGMLWVIWVIYFS